MALRLSGDGDINGNISLPPTTSIGNVSDTEIAFVDGVTSALQTQLNAKANLSAGYQYHSTIYYTSNGTFTKATYPWLRAIRIRAVGGGAGAGSGGATTNGGGWASAGGGGGAGGYSELLVTDIAGLSASVSVTIGAGGAAATGNAAGTNGGNTTGFGITCNGGTGGSGMAQNNAAASTAGGAGGTASGGDLNLTGGRGQRGTILPTLNFMNPGTGGSSILGAGGNGGADVSGAIIGTGNNGLGLGSGGSGGYSTNSSLNPLAGIGRGGAMILDLFA